MSNPRFLIEAAALQGRIARQQARLQKQQNILRSGMKSWSWWFTEQAAMRRSMKG